MPAIFRIPIANPSNLSLNEWVKTQDIALQFASYDIKKFPLTQTVISVDQKSAIKFTNELGTYVVIFIPLNKSVLPVLFLLYPSYPSPEFLTDHKGDIERILSTFRFD